MAAVTFLSGLGAEVVLNLDNITMAEKSKSAKSINLTFGKDHTHINLQTYEERDELFDKIKKAMGVD